MKWTSKLWCMYEIALNPVEGASGNVHDGYEISRKRKMITIHRSTGVIKDPCFGGKQFTKFSAKKPFVRKKAFVWSSLWRGPPYTSSGGGVQQLEWSKFNVFPENLISLATAFFELTLPKDFCKPSKLCEFQLCEQTKFLHESWSKTMVNIQYFCLCSLYDPKFATLLTSVGELNNSVQPSPVLLLSLVTMSPDFDREDNQVSTCIHRTQGSPDMLRSQQGWPKIVPRIILARHQFAANWSRDDSWTFLMEIIKSMSPNRPYL